MDVDKHPTLFCPLSPPSANYTILWYLLNFQIHCNLVYASAAAAKSLQSCPTLCDPMDCSLPGFSIPGILQARTLEWVAISFSNAWKWKVKVKSLSHVLLLATPWTAAYQAPPSMGFSRQQYWSGVPYATLIPQTWFKSPSSSLDCYRRLPTCLPASTFAFITTIPTTLHPMKLVHLQKGGNGRV